MSTTNTNDRLRAAAQEGHIDLLYTLIDEDPHVLEHTESIPFVETPLHIAASFGQLQFATEVMRLKPSFAWKLNQQGFSPIHLATQHGQERMVHRFVDINKDLVRVKGMEGLTPLHLASRGGDVNLLAHFLLACPDSIEDVTVRSETALHLAVLSNQYKALQVLVGWLKKIRQKDAVYLERTILKWKDEAGNTILHVSALNNFSQALRLLVKTGMSLNARNSENSTALDIARNGSNVEIIRILCAAGAKDGSSVTNNGHTRVDKLKSEITIVDQIIIRIFRIRSEISEEQRNAFLIVATLVATAGFQTALSPPGGVFQANAGDVVDNKNSVNTTSSINSTATAATQGNIGKSVMPNAEFLIFLAFSELSLVLSTLTMYVLTPGGKLGALLLVPVLLFFCCYVYSIGVISPEATSLGPFYVLLALAIFVFFGLCLMVSIRYKRLQYHTMKWAAKTRNTRIPRGNRW